MSFGTGNTVAICAYAVFSSVETCSTSCLGGHVCATIAACWAVEGHFRTRWTHETTRAINAVCVTAFQRLLLVFSSPTSICKVKAITSGTIGTRRAWLLLSSSSWTKVTWRAKSAGILVLPCKCRVVAKSTRPDSQNRARMLAVEPSWARTISRSRSRRTRVANVAI